MASGGGWWLTRAPIGAPVIDPASRATLGKDARSVKEPDYTDFEKRLDETADPIYKAGRTGYAWTPVDELLAAELKLPGVTRCKKATGSGRAANVLTESNDKSIDLYLVFIGPNYSRDAFITAADDRIRRFPNVRTVAVADHAGSRWRVRSIVERAGIGLAKQIQGSFPAVEDEDIIEVKADLDEEEAADASSQQPPAVPAVDPEIFESAMDAYDTRLEGLSGLVAQFRQFATESGVVLDEASATDLLAAILSSQLLLFAGPSGTGKSVSARLLQDFFAREDERAQIFEARRQWLSPDDLVGYYSVLGDQFATTPDTPKLIKLHDGSVAAIDGSGGTVDGPPIIVVEEINLSPPEGYLSPVIHGLSTVRTPFFEWDLHSRTAGAVDEASRLTLPKTAMIGPYPRVLGTINVDSTAHAPARKVAARGCVLLLEPEPLTQSDLTALAAIPEEGESGIPAGVAAPFLGDPLTALDDLDEENESKLQVAFLAIAGHLGGALVSRRDALRSLAYMAYFVRLRGDGAPDDDVVRLAAENAILHCVLPTVDADHFAGALQALTESGLMAAPASTDEIGGVLGTRAERLLEMTTTGLGFAEAVDFWSALS